MTNRIPQPERWKLTSPLDWWRMILGNKTYDSITALQDDKENHLVPDKIHNNEPSTK